MVRFNDTDIQRSYDIMHELRRGLTIHGYAFADKNGDFRNVVRLTYTTLDGKKHEISSTEYGL